MKTRSDDQNVILERKFERDDGTVVLKFYRPSLYPDLEYDSDNDPPWRCDYAIYFPDGEVQRRGAVGIDSVQALLLAFASAAGNLRNVGDGTPARRPPLRWLGEDDLGLTIKHFDF